MEKETCKYCEGTGLVNKRGTICKNCKYESNAIYCRMGINQMIKARICKYRHW